MAELQDLIGSILRDISHSRVMSDLYSREVSRYYESDVLLRHFSVPRVDISDIELDLKFALESLGQQHEVSYPKRISYQLRQTPGAIVSGIKDVLEKAGNTGGSGTEPDKIRMDSYNQLVEMIHNLLIKEVTPEFLQELNESNAGSLKNKILKLILSWDNTIERPNIRNDFKGLEDFITGQVYSMFSMLEFTVKTVKDFKVNVAFESDRLRHLPDETISSLKLKVEMKNYKWIKTTGDDEEVITRRLIEE